MEPASHPPERRILVKVATPPPGHREDLPLPSSPAGARSTSQTSAVVLGGWASRQRKRYRAGELPREQIAALEAIPAWTWQPHLDQQWEQNFARLRAFREEFGHADVPRGYRTPDGAQLGFWVSTQRLPRNRDQPDRARQLESVPGWGWTAAAARQNRLVAEVARYYATHGPGAVPKDYRPASDPALHVGRWVAKQVSDHTTGRIDPDLAAALEQIPGFSWGRREAIFADLVQRLAGYAAEHGTATPPWPYVSPDGYPLGQQAGVLRARHRNGELPADRAEALEKLPGWSWAQFLPHNEKNREQRFTAAADAVRAYAEKHGNCSPPAGTTTSDGANLAGWVWRMRCAYRDGTLTAERRAVLEAIPGWSWDIRPSSWDRGIAALRDYVAEHGTAVVPAKYRSPDGYSLGDWVSVRRRDKDKGRLSAEQIAILEAFPGWTWKLREQAWDEGLRRLRAYVAEHGTAEILQAYRTADNFPLGMWAYSRRNDLKKGRLSAERKAILESLPGWHWL